MPLYRWSSGSIAQMETTRTPVGTHRVVLRARADAKPDQLCAIENDLSRAGIKHFIDLGENGAADALVIPEIKDDKQVRTLLESKQHVQGQPQTIALKQDSQKDNKSAKLKKNSLMLAATFYNLGNISQITSGIMRGRHNQDGKFTSHDWSEMMVGVAFTLGNLLFTVYNPKEHKNEVNTFSDALADHLRSHGVEVAPPGNAVPEATKHGAFSGVNQKLKENIMPIMCLGEILGGALYIKAGSKLNDGKKNYFKMGAGGALMAGWSTSLFLDKPNRPTFDFKQDNALQHKSTGHKMRDRLAQFPGMSWLPESDKLPLAQSGAVQWASENPRGNVTRPLGMANNVLNIIGAFDERGRAKQSVLNSVGKSDHAYHKNKQYDFAWNIVTSSSFLIGHYFFGLSGDKKKDARLPEETAQFAHDLQMVAANVLSSIPPHMRDHAIEETSAYIAGIEGVQESKKEIAEAIAGRVERLRHSGFHVKSISTQGAAISM